jgi:hypothetical protein
VIDYYLSSDSQIWLLTPYGKGEGADLTLAEKRMLNPDSTFACGLWPMAYGLQHNRDRIDPARRGLHFTPSGVKRISHDPVWGLLAHRL